MNVTEFDHQVFDITTEISRQVFPLTLNTRDSRFRAGLERMRLFHESREALSDLTGLVPKLKRAGLIVASGLMFVRLFLLPAQHNDMPDQVRMQPAW